MAVVMLLLCVAFMTLGGWAVVTGAPIIQIERGWAMVIAGTVALSAGAVMLGVFAVLRSLAHLSALAAPPRSTDGAPVHEDGAVRPRPAPAPADPEPENPVPSRHAPVLQVPTVDPSPPAAEPPPHVVGTYEADGSAYVMYSDGSIVARTATGTSRFDSIDDLKASVPSRRP